MKYLKTLKRYLISYLLILTCMRNVLANSDISIEQQSDEENIFEPPPVKKTLSSKTLHHSNPNDHQYTLSSSCSFDDFACMSMAAIDKLGLESIQTLHKQLDDDEDGNIDYAESDDFLKAELKINSGAEKRQKAFHRNNDMHISVKELWEAWLKSEVHNWTVEQTTDWLINNVHLPQYVTNFVLHKVTGANLPRLAVNNGNYLAMLGIKDPIHKQKISLKAMDVVLFGPPKDGMTWKDITLILSAFIVFLGSWLVYQQNKKFKNHLKRMNKDMDSLQNSEQALEILQKQLEEAKQAEEFAVSEKQNLEKLLQGSKGDLPSLNSAYSESDITHYKEEIKTLKAQLEMTQAAFKNSCFLAPPGLQQWLQLTYELEQKSYDKKKIAAEKQLQQAREACEKLRKKRSSLIGAFVSTHGKAIDDVDRAIVEARSALNEVTYELQERTHRWRQIESLCGFPITINNGLQSLESVLYKKHERVNGGLGGRMNSVDDLDDDTGSVFGIGSSYSEIHPHMTSWNEDLESSSSENGKQEENVNTDSTRTQTTAATNNAVSFQIGGGSFPEDLVLKSSNLVGNKSASQSNINIITKSTAPKLSSLRALSHDTASTAAAAASTHLEEISKNKTLSDSGLLEHPKSSMLIRQATIPEVSELRKKTNLIDDDVCSTDSSVIEEIDAKKKKRKLFNFSKKSSSSSSSNKKGGDK